ncbi:MAG TPA: hypothetical protein VKR23_03365 [Gaiellaceae bacterium]|nr:hypothetical protein [Gaiellaceae bacterium]
MSVALAVVAAGNAYSNAQDLDSESHGVPRAIHVDLPADLVKAILAADPHALFCQNVTQASIGSGLLWGDVFGRRLAIITINPPVP